ncbi:putative ABC transport system ATP-binding protein [Carnobacterium iners]|uniref:Putative ABC transport system ATP-binding protein n=1 Tax=Carnobacterium iners TaxID=1073423 RepID=A0A1X7N0K8_9LACT|nr:ATP-binding cassette domain-containing protein [Carnobacterium iners]SEK20653.1 putative ABC transport system ATP-binding protein [Carnobacterium iners]SMH30328.1 putative ABC transport system ATP-binding protein [Carnobacterium iners]
MYESIVELNHVSFKVADKLILNDVSFSVDKGEFVTITGPSGSGKSTLLKIIASMLSQTAGTIHYKGKKIEEYNPIDYRKEVSYGFQTAVLFGKTVEDNLIFPYEIRQILFDQDKAISYLEKVGLDESYLTKNINDLSGGEKQRIALIRNVLFLPEVLLLDEVTSALDEENKQVIGRFVKEMNQTKQITVLWVTHNSSEVEESDRVINIINGGVEEKNGLEHQ